MSDCCKVPEPAVENIDDRCHRCGEKGRRVLRETMESLLTAEALERLTGEPYYFDRTPDCDVVYFTNQGPSYFDKESLTVRVGLKEKAPPIPLCYCFGHSEESVREEIVTTGRSTVTDRITAEVQADHCACEIKNPSGKCCLGDVSRAVRRIEKELEEQPVAPMEKG